MQGFQGQREMHSYIFICVHVLTTCRSRETWLVVVLLLLFFTLFLAPQLHSAATHGQWTGYLHPWHVDAYIRWFLFNLHFAYCFDYSKNTFPLPQPAHSDCFPSPKPWLCYEICLGPTSCATYGVCCRLSSSLDLKSGSGFKESWNSYVAIRRHEYSLEADSSPSQLQWTTL